MATITVRELNVEYQIWNEESTETLVLLHGFTGNIATWETIVSLLPNTIKIVAIDLIGHGKTDAPENIMKYSMLEQIQVLEEVFDQLSLTSFTLLGYSMGGRVALSYAVAFPNRIKQLILESSSPGLKTQRERLERKLSDEKLALRIMQDGLEAFVNYWENIPLFASQKSLPFEIQQKIRQQRLSQRKKGLANSLRGMGTGVQKSHWEQLDTLNIPVLLITGSLDKKYYKIAEEMKNLLQNAIHIEVIGAGHTIHVENPTQFVTIIKDVISVD